MLVLLLLLLGTAALAVVLRVAARQSPVLVGRMEEQLVTPAVSAEPGDLAQRVLDGRRRGMDTALRVAGSRLTLRFALELPLAGVAISISGPGSVRVIDGGELGGDGRVVWLDGAARRRLALQADATVSEVEPIISGGPVLVAPPGGGDWEVEILRAHGLAGTGRVSAGDLPRALRTARVVLVANHVMPPPARQALAAWARAGGLVIELGPEPAACGPPAPESGEPGELEDGTRFPGRIAVEPPPPGTASVRLRDGRPLVVSRGSCTRWLGDVAAAVAELRFGQTPALARSDLDVPSADLLVQRLLAQVVAAPGPDVLIAPLPAAHRSVLVLTADQDYAPDALIVAQARSLPAGALTVLLTSARVGGAPDVSFKTSPADMAGVDTVRWLAGRGDDIGIHPNTKGVAPGPAIAAHAARFAETYGQAPRISRSHHLSWSADMPRLLAEAHLAMDLSFVSLARLPEGDLGFQAGGGVPLAFVDSQKEVLPLLQQPTHLDDHGLLPQRFGYRKMDVAALLARSRRLLELAVGAHVPLVANHHPYWWGQTGGAWQSGLIAQAGALGVPVWSAGRWLRFVEARRRALIAPTNGQLHVHVPTAGMGLWIEGEREVSSGGRTIAPGGEIKLGSARLRAYAVPPGLVVVR